MATKFRTHHRPSSKAQETPEQDRGMERLFWLMFTLVAVLFLKG